MIVYLLTGCPICATVDPPYTDCQCHHSTRKRSPLPAIVRTLGDAVDLIDEGLPETLRFRSTWREVKEMLVTAAETRTSRAVEDATTLLEHILEDEGWLEH